MQEHGTRVYTWEIPVRLTHWINALSILSLSITGFYIGSPFMHALSAKQYIMGWMRFIHYVSAYAFLMSIIIRIYWAFSGNKYASWKAWFPFGQKERRGIIDGLKFYLLISRKPPHAVGHTATAGITYLFVFFLFIFEAASGFAMYSLTHKGLIWFMLGGWMTGVLNIQMIRLLHHLVMYLLLAFAVLHVYIALMLESAEKNGLMMSIFNGYKFITGKEQEQGH